MIKPFLTSAFIFCLTVVVAQDEQTFTLQQAIDFALENNYASRQSALEIESSMKKVRETIGIGLPQINASANFQQNLDIATQVFPDFIGPTVYTILIDEDLLDDGSAPKPGVVPAQFGTEFNAGAGVSVSQLLFDGSYLIGLKATRIFVDMRKSLHEKTQADTRESITDAYVTVLIARENAEILRNNFELMNKLFDETKVLYKEGFVEEQDVDQLNLTLSGIENSMLNAERQAIMALNVLKFQMGIALTTKITLSEQLDQLLIEANGQALDRTFNIENHPDNKVAETNLALNKLNLRNEKSQYLPKLYGFFQHQQSAQRDEFDLFDSNGKWYPATSWGINLMVPIFSSGIKHNLVQQRALDVQKADILKEQASAAVHLVNEKARSDYLFELDNYLTKKLELELAQKIRNKTEIKYKEGLSSSLELNQIQNQFLQSQGNYVQSRLELLKAKVALDKALNNYEK